MSVSPCFDTKCKYPPLYHGNILKTHLVYRFVPVEFILVQFPIFTIDQVYSMDYVCSLHQSSSRSFQMVFLTRLPCYILHVSLLLLQYVRSYSIKQFSFSSNSNRTVQDLSFDFDPLAIWLCQHAFNSSFVLFGCMDPPQHMFNTNFIHLCYKNK